MAQLEPATPAGGVRVTHDVDGAAVCQQMIEFGMIGEFVDPRQVDHKEPTRIIRRGIEAIEIHRLASGIGANAPHVAFGDPLCTVTTRRAGPLRRWRRRATGSPAAISITVCGFDALLR